MGKNEQFVKSLSCWQGTVSLQPLGGGITNVNYVVEDAGQKYVVRVGEDIPMHQVMRFNELAASVAAHATDISPEVVHHQPGALVIRYIDGTTFEAEDVQKQINLVRILPIIKKCHLGIPKHLRGPAMVFWVFHVLRDYAATIDDGKGRLALHLPDLMKGAECLEKAVGPVDLVYGHNDLLAANFIDDGEKIWLIDWDYAGFNSPLFDLGGLASNNGLSTSQETWLLENYFEKPITDELLYRYAAMKCASLLRETLWSMVSEIHSKIDFDFVTYTDDNLKTYQSAYTVFNEM